MFKTIRELITMGNRLADAIEELSFHLDLLPNFNEISDRIDDLTSAIEHSKD